MLIRFVVALKPPPKLCYFSFQAEQVQNLSKFALLLCVDSPEFKLIGQSRVSSVCLQIGTYSVPSIPTL